jgi:hypothetical protein
MRIDLARLGSWARLTLRLGWLIFEASIESRPIPGCGPVAGVHLSLGAHELRLSLLDA